MIIPPTWNLPEAIRKRLGQTTYGRQRAIFEGDHLLLVLHRPPGAEDSRREGILFWRNPSGEWMSSRGGPGVSSLKRHVQSYAELEQKLTQEYEAAEDTDTLFRIMEAATPLVRAARNMHQTIQNARESLPGDIPMIELRDQAYEIERNLELLVEDTRNALHYRTARESEAQARLSQQALQANHRLNILAALFFPLTAIASLFGMNLAHGLDTNKTAWFWLVLVIGVGLGMVLKTWVLGGSQTLDDSGAQAKTSQPKG